MPAPPIIAPGTEDVRIRLSHPGVADELRSALEDADCVAALDTDDTVDVELPWATDETDARQARLELMFFVKAWQAQHPGLEAAFVEAA
jgi:hypothetical protein